MPTTYGKSPFNSRTYAKGSGSKRRTSEDDTKEEVPLPEPTRKRRKLSVQARSQSPNDLKKSTSRDGSTDIEDSHPPETRKPAVKVTYGSPRKNTLTTATDLPPLPEPRTPRKLARDLSGIFESLTSATSPSPAASPVKLSKRMLARSKTETFIEDQSPTSDRRVKKNSSLPILPSSSPPKPQPLNDRPSIISDTISSLPPPTAPPLAASTNKRTYAGKSRSFLVSLPASSVPSSSYLPNEDEEDEYSRESYTSLRTRWGVDNSEDDPYPPYPTELSSSSTSGTPSKRKRKEKSNRPPPLPAGMMNPIRSITELRSKGENRRFLDEIGYLFEGMDSTGGVGLRRASGLEITTKLCETEFARNTKAVDLYGKIWDVFIEAGAGRAEDKILDILFLFYVTLALRDGASHMDLVHRSPSEEVDMETSSISQKHLSLPDTLFLLLDSSVDPLALVNPNNNISDEELRVAGISKKDKSMLTTVYNTIAEKSSLFIEDTPISTSILITRSLQTLPSYVLPSKKLLVLLSSLRQSLSPSHVISPSSSLSSNLFLDWREASAKVHYENIYNHLKLLDLYLLGQWDSPSPESQDAVKKGKETNAEILDSARDDWLVDELVAFGICAELRVGDSEVHRAHWDIANRCLEITFRVLVSLTHGSELWGAKVMQSEYALGWIMRVIGASVGDGNGKWRGVAKKEEETDLTGEGKVDVQEIHAFDRLCLSLGLLTNLVQVVESAKDSLRNTNLDPACILRKRACLKSCTCANTISALHVLVRLYNQQLPKSSPSRVAKIKPDPLLSAEEATDSSANPDTDADASASFLRGHLAVLFGLVMRGNRANQEVLLATLPHPSVKTSGKGGESRAKVNALVDQAREFTAFYAAISGGNEDTDETKVARSVLKLLERLGDSFT